eukprot:g14357.t1
MREHWPRVCVSPGGVGFDINCGVRLLRTNLTEEEIAPVKESLTQALFDHIPVGVGSLGIIPIKEKDLEDALQLGIDWSLREGYAWAEDKEHCEEYGRMLNADPSKVYAWPEDKEHCEEYGRMLNADPSKVSARAKKRGLPQLGTLGAGNHLSLQKM